MTDTLKVFVYTCHISLNLAEVITCERLMWVRLRNNNATSIQIQWSELSHMSKSNSKKEKEIWFGCVTRKKMKSIC